MQNKIRSYSVLFLMIFAFLAPVSLWGQMKMSYPISLQWKGVAEERVGTDTLLIMALESAEYNGIMPVFCQSFPIYDDAVKVEARLLDVKVAPLSDEEMRVARDFSYGTDFEVNAVPLR